MSIHAVFWTAVGVVDAIFLLRALLRALLRGHGVAGTFAWMLAIIAFPGLGALAYFLFAEPFLARTTRRKRRTSATIRRLLAERAGGTGKSDAPWKALTPRDVSILHLATGLTGLLPTMRNRLEILTENVPTFARIEAAILAARRFVWAEYYIIQNDTTGTRFLDLLTDRARAGVDVRLLFDAAGSSSIDRVLVARLVAAGGKAEPFLPMNPLRRKWSIHLRNHRKIVVVDGDVGFTGGMNIGDEYSGGSRRRKVGPWRDTHLEVRGPAVHDLALVFAEDWTFAADEKLLPPDLSRSPPSEVEPGAIVAMLPSGPDQLLNAHRFLYFAGIATARERCWITSPYFVPDDSTVLALQSAALRGVDVRLIVPAKTDVAIVMPAARSFYQVLAETGVRIFEYQAEMLHAKTIVVDGTWGVVGSANMDMRSFRLNFEVGAAVFDPAFAARLEAIFLRDLEKSEEIGRAALRRKSRLRRLQESVARLLSPLL